jgi:hypothetical protein
MVPKIKERLLNAGVSCVTAFGAVFIAFALNSGSSRTVQINKELKQKAPFDYVDARDSELKSEINRVASDAKDDDAAIIKSLDEIKQNQRTDRELIIEAIRQK